MGVTVVASFADHLAYAEPPIRPVLVELRKRIMALDRPERRIKENVTTHRRLAYSVVGIFAEVKVRKKQIQVRFFEAGVSDPKNLVTDIKKYKWPWPNQITVDSVALVDYAMPFIEASYRSHRAD
jgi:predicted transport protein